MQQHHYQGDNMQQHIVESYLDRLGWKDSEIDNRALASASLNITASKTSSQRLHMDASHLKQHLSLCDGDKKRFFTGVERNYGEEAHMAQFPVDCIRVIDVITKYAGILPRDMESPLTLIVYERGDNNQIDVLEVNANYFQHQKFGFPLVRTPESKGIIRHKAFRKGTIIAKPPAITDELDYKFGKELKVFLGNCKAGIEDGAWISDEAAYSMRTKAYGELEMSLSKKDIPLNINGTETHFKPIPDIGDFLRDDGLVMAWREYHRDFPMSLYNTKALMQHSQLDNLRFGEIPNELKFENNDIVFSPNEGEEIIIRPRVVDIEVLKGGSSRVPITKSEEQLNRYWERTVRFYEQIKACDEELERLIPGYELSPAWQRWCDSAQFYANTPNGTRQEIFKRDVIPNWYVKIKFEYTFIPGIGSKFTNIHAGKTVVVKKTPRSQMPRDKDGNYADFVVEDISAINRMNPGVLDEMRLGSCELATRKRIKEMYESGVTIDKIYEYYAGFMKIVSPMTYHHVMSPIIDRKVAVEDILVNGIDALVPPSLSPMMIDILKELTEKYPPCRDLLELTRNDGTKVWTDDPAEIGVLYMMSLERVGDTFAAVNSAKRQHHGIPTKASRTDRHSFPVKISSTRFPSEADTKSVQSHLNNEAISELMDRSLNPVSHRIVCKELIRNPNPGQIKDAVPRDKFPRKGNRVIAIRDNMLFTAGLRIKEGKDGNKILLGDEGYNE